MAMSAFKARYRTHFSFPMFRSKKENRRTHKMREEDMSMDLDPEFVYTPPQVKPPQEKNAHLKGRKRFNADLEDLKGECATGMALHGFVAKSK